MTENDLPTSSRMGVPAAIPAADFAAFRDFLHQACGIYLAENKQYLVSTRIRKILVEHKLASLSELIERIKGRNYSALREVVIDAMTTNETFWFRDNYPYDYLASHLFTELNQASGAGSIRIWSAACSSGQEPYSISMVAEECRRKNSMAFRRNVEVVATDLSGSMLEQAKLARYDKMAVVRGLSTERRQLHFDELSNDEWQVKEPIRRRVQFKALNLMHPYSTLGKFDIIFCRNVLIYFNADLKQDILRRMHAVLKPGGVLFLGSSEGVGGVNDLFEMVHCSPGILYRAR